MLLLSFLLLVSLFVVVKSANFSIRYATRLAESLNLPKYIIGFTVVAVISILPETFVAITSSIEGIPAFGLGTLFGSNIADLTLVFALVVFLSGRKLKIESRLIKNRFLHIGAIAVPIILGLDGYYSRLDAAILILIGILFYCIILKKNLYIAKTDREKFRFKNIIFLLLSMSGLLIGSHFTVKYGVNLAYALHISPVLVGMLVVGLGTTLPELFFSVKAAKHHHDDLALGDILGTVIADATIVVGIIALISPFFFNLRIIYVTGTFMFLAIFLLFIFMKSDRSLSYKEAGLLLIFYFVFVISEFIVNH